MTDILNYGGGRQTVALCLLIARGIWLPPDRIVIADTGREKRSTWDYLEAYTRPLLKPLGLEIEIAPRTLATVDLYSHNGTLLMPVFTATGKLSAYCSSEWKREVVARHLRASGVSSGVNWIGFAADESKRIKSQSRGKWSIRFPLIELMLTKENCQRIILDHGWPLPPPSSCWMCPNMGNAEWREIRDNRPDEFVAACVLDEELRTEDIERGGSGVYLHASRVPLRLADLDASDRRDPSRQCGLGTCFV